MKAEYRKFSKKYIEHLASLPQNRNIRTYQKWGRKQRKQIKEEKQIWHIFFSPKSKWGKLHEGFVKSWRENRQFWRLKYELGNS